MDWIELNSDKQLDDVIASNELSLIFKHSTRCSISSMALSRMDSANLSTKNYLLDLIAHRDLSNRIATELNVWHESPQVILFKGKEVYLDESHMAINPKELDEEIKRVS